MGERGGVGVGAVYGVGGLGGRGEGCMGEGGKGWVRFPILKRKSYVSNTSEVSH